MGISADATLAFGIDLGDSLPYVQYNDDYEAIHPEWENFEGDFDEFLAIKAGHKDPWESMPEGYSYEDRRNFPEFDKATDEWSEIKQRLAAEAPVTLEYYGMPVYDYTAYALVLNDSRFSRGEYGETNIQKVGLPEQPTTADIEAAANFCRELGLPDFAGPTWLLLTNVG